MATAPALAIRGRIASAAAGVLCAGRIPDADDVIRLRTNPSCRAPPTLTARAAWQHQRADEAGWEAQIRRMAKLQTREAKTAVTSAVPPIVMALVVIKAIKRLDTLLIPRDLPLAVGIDAEDLVCGGCGTIIASRISRESARRRHPEGERVVVRCSCRALNLLHGAAAPAAAGRRLRPRRRSP